MSDDNKIKSSPKKGIPGGLLILLLAVVFTFLTIQNLGREKMAKVSFSHQVEHLVNLDLLQPQESRKIADKNDNLVTFSGKFKDAKSDDAKARYRYLELLNANHQLTLEKTALEKNLQSLKSSVQTSADWFLHLSGESIPKRGYVVVGPFYDLPGSENAVVIRTLSDRQIVSLRSLEGRLSGVNSANVEEFGRDVKSLIEGFRSPALGIGIQLPGISTFLFCLSKRSFNFCVWEKPMKRPTPKQRTQRKINKTSAEYFPKNE